MELPPPLYIDTPAELERWVESLRHVDLVAVDTESDSLHHYREKVCLIQMTAGGVDVIIDPLRVRDLQSLGPMFADPKRLKVFHDACYDLISLTRDFGFKFAGLFDTMLASRFLGYKEFGLASILKARFDFNADKRLQRSDWAQRPLSADQISYARYDTHFLPRLTAILQNELAERGRATWATQEFERLPDVARRATPRLAGSDPDGFWRVRGIRAFAPAVKGRIRELYMMRERLAERLDRPPFKVLGDAVLVDLAMDPPVSMATFEPRPGLRRAGVERFGPDIMRALAHAKAVSGDAPPGSGRRRRSGRFLDPETKVRFENLRVLRKAKAEGLGLDPEVALSNAFLEDVSRTPPKTRDEVAARPELSGWRQDVFVTAIFESLSTPVPKS